MDDTIPSLKAEGNQGQEEFRDLEVKGRVAIYMGRYIQVFTSSSSLLVELTLWNCFLIHSSLWVWEERYFLLLFSSPSSTSLSPLCDGLELYSEASSLLLFDKRNGHDDRQAWCLHEPTEDFSIQSKCPSICSWFGSHQLQETDGLHQWQWHHHYSVCPSYSLDIGSKQLQDIFNEIIYRNAIGFLSTDCPFCSNTSARSLREGLLQYRQSIGHHSYPSWRLWQSCRSTFLFPSLSWIDLSICLQEWLGRNGGTTCIFPFPSLMPRNVWICVFMMPWESTVSISKILITMKRISSVSWTLMSLSKRKNNLYPFPVLDYCCRSSLWRAFMRPSETTSTKAST